MTTDELKPCPFCGGPAELWGQSGNRLSWVGCMGKCSVLVTREYRTDAEVIAAWNTRTESAEVIALREREARLVEALRPFSAMASEMFAANWNDDGVAISFVTKDGPMRITFKEFREAHAAHAALKEATATGRGTGTHKEERGRGDDLHQRDDLVVSRG